MDAEPLLLFVWARQVGCRGLTLLWAVLGQLSWSAIAVPAVFVGCASLVRAELLCAVEELRGMVSRLKRCS